MDKCNKCGCELKVIKGVNIIENDDSPDKQTRLFRLLTLKCPNPKCDALEVEKRVELEIGG